MQTATQNVSLTVQPAANPSLLSASDFMYLGAFRIPNSMVVGFGLGGFCPCITSDGTLLLANRARLIAEMTIPTPGISTTVAGLPIAEQVHPFTDLSAGLKDAELGGGAGSNGLRMGGMLQVGNEILATMYGYYDAGGSAVMSHYFCKLNWSAPSSRGLYALDPPKESGYVAGYMFPVPAVHREAIGSPYITGQCGIPIVTRTSHGPAARGFDPATLGATPAPVSRLLDYPSIYAYGAYSVGNQSPDWNMTSTAQGGGFFHRSIGFVGWSGIGKIWYGAPKVDFTNNPDPTLAALGVCVDPTGGDQGPHSSAWATRIWLYDPADIIAVKQGLKQRWEPRPYAIVNLDFPHRTGYSLGGAAFDPATNRLYIVSNSADMTRNFYEPSPIIHVYQLPN